MARRKNPPAPRHSYLNPKTAWLNADNWHLHIGDMAKDTEILLASAYDLKQISSYSEAAFKRLRAILENQMPPAPSSLSSNLVVVQRIPRRRKGRLDTAALEAAFGVDVIDEFRATETKYSEFSFSLKQEK